VGSNGPGPSEIPALSARSLIKTILAQSKRYSQRRRRLRYDAQQGKVKRWVPALKKRQKTAALIGSPELFSNPDKARSTLAFCCVWIVNNSAGPGADLFRAWIDLIMKIWRTGRPRTSRTILLPRIVWRSFGPSGDSEPDEPLAKGSMKSRCKYFTVLGFPPQQQTNQT
jgi:uncharacterized protein YllA (UPF0747 family)